MADTGKRRRINRLWRNRPHPLNALWHWASGHGPKRWKALVKWTGQRAKAARDRHVWKRSRWWVAKRTVYRKKLKAARKHAQQGKQPRYERWMANGCDDRVNQGVKDFVARGVVLYDLTTTSLARTFVPAGGSATSYHLLSVNNPARAGDMAGRRMANFQHSEFKRGVGRGDYLELFGPINDEWVKNGQRTGGAEGTALEELHDTHDHGAFA